VKIDIVPAGRADLPAIDRFLIGEWSEYRPPRSATPLRERNWLPGNEVFGFCLLVDGQLAGFLGASYSLRPVDGKMERFCAIGPWFVKEEHRSQSLRMLFKLLAGKDTTYVNYTPSRPMFKLFTGLGFAALDEAKLLIPPFLNLPRLRPWRGRLVTARSEVRQVLSGEELKIFDDHVGTRCRHLAIVDGNRVCHLAAGRRILRGMPFSEILHVSEPALLGPQIERIVWALCRHFRAVAVAADERLLAGSDVSAIRYRLNSPAVFKSARVARDKIDNMWSELAF
jgi:hypothetical protein